MTNYAFKNTVSVPMDEVEDLVRTALASEGFGVITEIDFKKTLKAKLDVDFRPYKVLGACNPPLAYQALGADVDIGLLLPCNVLIYEGDAPGTTVVAAIDPVRQLGVAGRDDLGDLAEEVAARLRRVVDGLPTG
ncbi:MAG: DUF302 domain-containing protein [Gemmatimonadota bacterium]